MLENASNSELLAAWKSGNQAAATILYRRYMARLTAFARAHLSRRLARRCDPEDIVLSAWRSFFVAMRDTQSPQPDDLWPLLATIAFRKLTAQAARHGARKRSFDKEVLLEDWSGLLTDDPPPEHAALIADEILWIMKQLAPLQREVLSLTLRGKTAADIADELGCSARTVRRGLEQVRELLNRGDKKAESPERFEKTAEPHSLPGSNGIASDAPRKESEAPFPAQPPALKIFTDKDFLLQQYIGSGAFSRIYRSLSRDDGKTVAIKFLRKALWQDERSLETLRREVQIAHEVQHPHLVACEGWGLCRGTVPFLVLQWIDGEQVGKWVTRLQPTSQEIVRKLLPILDAIESSHARGIVHCDLTPANILIDGSGKPWLTDLGLASFSQEPRKAEGGTPGFLAPEQVSEAFGHIDQRTDIYGFGGLLHALLTGAPPHTGRDIAEILANVLSTNAVSPARSSGHEIPNSLSEILGRCLRKEPADRPANVADVRRMLENFLQNG